MDLTSKIRKAIHARVTSSIFPAMLVEKNGKPQTMQVDGAVDVKPATFELHESQAEFGVDTTYGRGMRSRKTSSDYDLILVFPRRVSFASFEQGLCNKPISVDRDSESPNAIITLSKAVYGATTRSGEGECIVLFTFNVRIGRS